jgi:hypothetical protein
LSSGEDDRCTPSVPPQLLASSLPDLSHQSLLSEKWECSTKYRATNFSILCVWRKERRLRVFESRVLREIFGAKRDEVTGVEKTT